MKLIVEPILNESIQYLTEGDEKTKNYFIEGIFMQSGIKNRNGRIYPSEILENEVNRYNTTHVKENRAVGELNHPCLKETAEVLTKDGWKKISEVTIEDEVYTLNPSNKKIEYNKVLHVHKNMFTGNMLNFKHRTFNTVVTPYHRMLTVYRNGKSEFQLAKDIKHSFDNKISRINKYYIPKSGDFTLNDEVTSIDINGTEYNFKDFCAFMGLYLSEGYTNQNSANSWTIMLYQNEGKKANKIQELLDRMPLNFTKRKNGNKIRWYVTNADLGEYLFRLGKCYNKYLPREIINYMSRQTANEFIDWYVLGDGRKRSNGDNKDVFSTSEKMIDNLCEIAVIAGLSFRKYVKMPEERMIEGRIILKENQSPLYFMEILSSNGVYLDNRHMKIEEEYHNDYVYCLTTENSNFMVRDNGINYWTGNCSVTVSYDRVSHLITNLRKEGNDFIGKAKILSDLPMGKIAEGLIKNGVRIGVSSRGLGSVKQNKEGIMEVQKDFHLATVDIVADPSAPSAFVNGILEGVEYIFDAAKGTYLEQHVEQIQKDVKENHKKMSDQDRLKLMENFLNGLRKI